MNPVVDTPAPTTESQPPLVDLVEEDDSDLLIEDVSIDGMCGVY
ncbi:MAG TPA: mycofactocin precursor MftA [Rugosimonospora sp.]|nr:mycofactocin precursor MftA [Rugosimonospora sp.]